MNREHPQIDVDRDRLCVWGEKRLDSERQGADCHLVLCACGSFFRELMLPQPVDANPASASYRDGVLRIEMPRLERGRSRRIQISWSTSPVEPAASTWRRLREVRHNVCRS